MRGVPPASSTSECPGGSLWMPSNIESGASISRSARYWSSAARFIRGGRPSKASSALISDAQAKPRCVVQVVERLLSEVIARSEQAATLHVPQHEREHAAQAMEQPVAVALVQRDDDLAVAVRQKCVAVALELAAQLAVVVDLPVADQEDRAVGVVQRLLAAREIDDRQAAVAERRELVVIDPFAVRAAMRERVQHAAHRAVARRIRIDDTCDAAHA